MRNCALMLGSKFRYTQMITCSHSFSGVFCKRYRIEDKRIKNAKDGVGYPVAVIGNDLRTLDWVTQCWDLPAIQSVESISTPHGGVLRLTFSDGTVRFLKRMEDEERIHTTDRITEMLALHGIPVAGIVLARDGQWGATHEEAHYLLTNELKGHAFQELSVELGKEYGKGLASLHEALKQIPSSDDSPSMDLVQDVIHWAMPGTREAAEQLERIEEGSDLFDSLTACGLPLIERLPTQWIHRDPHPGNMLYGDDGRMGFLDFELSIRGVRLFDLCYLCTSQWMSAYTDTGRQNVWVELVGQVRSGYEQVSPLLAEERQAAFFVMCAIQMIFVSYWKDQGQEEQVTMNLQALLELSKRKGQIDAAFQLD